MSIKVKRVKIRGPFGEKPRARFHSRWHPPTGFTLIELLFVIIVVGALAALVLPHLAGRSEQAQAAACRAFIEVELASALRLFEMDMGRFPASEEGLGALLNRPARAKSWKGPYLKKRPADPWGRRYQYVCPGVHNPRSYDLWSLGKDGETSEDDITNWQE